MYKRQIPALAMCFGPLVLYRTAAPYVPFSKVFHSTAAVRTCCKYEYEVWNIPFLKQENLAYFRFLRGPVLCTLYWYEYRSTGEVSYCCSGSSGS